MKREDIKAWIITLLFFVVVGIIGNYFGIKLENSAW
jgi:LytS/YehU family sensor histidine kinase